MLNKSCRKNCRVFIMGLYGTLLFNKIDGSLVQF